MKGITIVLPGSTVHVGIYEDETVFFDSEIQELTFEHIEYIYTTIQKFKSEQP